MKIQNTGKAVAFAVAYFVGHFTTAVANVAPTLTPPTRQVVAVSESPGDNIVFSANGGSVSSLPTDPTDCGPWVPIVGDYWYHWDVPDSYRIVDGGTDEDDYVELAVNTAGSGDLSVELVQNHWDDSYVTLYAEATSGLSPRVPYDIIKVEIQGNDTDAQDDDLMREKITTPFAARWEYPCRARISEPIPVSADVSVVLTNSNGKLRFPDSSNTTKEVTLAKNGEWTSFNASGESRSTSKDDTLIQARIGTATGKIAGSEDFTVFFFDPNDITIASGGNYRVEEEANSDPLIAQYMPPNFGVEMRATARLKPDGLQQRGPHLENLKIGICQNALANATYLRLYHNPVVIWNAGVSSATISASLKHQATTTLPFPTNDSDPASNPLYSKVGAALGEPRLSSQSTEGAYDTDSPSTYIFAVLEVDAIDISTGNKVGKIRYEAEDVLINIHFNTWCVTYLEGDPHPVVPLRQTSWQANLSALNGPHACTVPTADQAVTSIPASGAPYTNAEFQTGPYFYRGPHGSGSKNITYPATN